MEVKIKLTNTKKKYNDKFNSWIFKPTDTNLQSKIILVSDIDISIQFKLTANYIKSIEICYHDQIQKFNNIPLNGILVNSKISRLSPIEITFVPIDLCAKLIIRDFEKFNPNTFVNVNWDHIYIINLSRRPDRKKEMIDKLTNLNINPINWDFIEAVDGQDPQIIEQFNMIKKKNPSNPIVTTGHFACLLSHIKAIEMAKQNNYSKVLILEDDVFFDNNFFDTITNIKLPEFSMLYLGGILSRQKVFLNNWAKANKIMGAYAYIINSSMYDILLDKLKKLEQYVDILYIEQIQKEYMVFILNDIITTDLTSSDTSGKSKIMVDRLNFINNNKI